MHTDADASSPHRPAARRPATAGSDQPRGFGRRGRTHRAAGRGAALNLQQALRAVHARLHRGDDEQGSVMVWLLVLAPVLFAFAGLVLDGGRAISARQDAANLAEQGARTAVDQLSDSSRDARIGAQFLQVDAGAAQSAACGYVDGARPGADCSTTVAADGQVQVSVTIQTPTAILGLIGVRQLTASGSGQARPAFGATQEVPQ